MAISRDSTQADIVAQYLDNVGYDHSASTASCKLFIQACRALLVMHPNDWSQADARIAFDPRLWKAEQQSAEQWLAANSSTVGQNSIRHLAFGSDFR